MSVAETIRRKLTAAFRPTAIEVVDESRFHAGHAGAREGGETHFRVEIVAEAFTGLPRVARHRMINEVLADELSGGVHALAIAARAPQDVQRPR